MQQDKALNILLVDDDATDRELFIEAINLSGKGYKVAESANGSDALNLLKTTDVLPDLIILDLNMPVMDGRDTLKQIKQLENIKSIPVCIMSTSNAHFDIINAYESGASLFLVKPFDFKDLIEMLNSLLTLFSKYVTLPNSVGNKVGH